MKRVTFIFLFFCLSITTILAQVVTTNIATPVAGLSTNSVTDFDVNSDGTILNNSATGGTALGTTVTGNGNITAGSEASLILLQVTGTSGSDLDGTIEVFGGEAGLIIANPNGIECDGCAFTNVNRVDLVTGSGYDADTNRFSTIAAADIDISSSGLTAPVLKVQTGADFNNAGAIVADTVTIDVTNFANDIANTGTVSATSLNIIFTADLLSSATSFNKFSFNNLAITAGGYFINRIALDLDNLTIKTGGNFDNIATINAASFTTTVGTNFANGGQINTDSLTVTTTTFRNRSDSTINADSLTVTAETFFTDLNSVINATNFTVTAETFFTDLNSVINTTNLTVTANDFTNNSVATINATSFTATVGENFNNNNNAVINADSITVTANSFNNTGGSTIDAASFTLTTNNFNNTGGVVSADALTVSVAGDFDYEGTITTNAFNLQVGGDFSYNDSASDFTWGAQNSLVVSGDANIVAADFANSGNITVINSFNATVDAFLNQTGATITAFECDIVHTTSYTDNGTIDCLESGTTITDIARPTNGLSNNSYTDFNILSTGVVFNNSDSVGTSQLLGNLSKNPNYNEGDAASIILVQVDGTDISLLVGTLEVFGAEAGLIIANPNGISCNACAFINASRVDLVTGSNYDAGTNTFGSIAATDITVGGSGLDAASVGILNIQTGADFNNAGAINTNNLNITAGDDFSNSATINNTDTVTIEVTNFANDITNSGTISSASLNFILTDDFTHSSTTFNAFNNFSNLAITTNGTFTNTDTIDLDGNLTITANTFNNTGGVVDVDEFALSVAGAFDFANNGTITANAYNLNIGGDFSNNDAANDFTWGDSDILTVGGSASIVAADFANSGTITVTNSLNLTADTFANSGGVLNAGTLALSVAGDFEHSVNIIANTYNLQVGGDFSYNDAANDLVLGATDTLTVSGSASIVAADFENSGAITVTNSGNFTANTFANTGTVNAATVTIEVTNFVDDITNSGTVSATSLNFILTDDFTHISDSFNAFNNFSNLAITTNGAFTNNNNIDLAGDLAITADGAFTTNNNIDLAGDFTLTANTFNNTGGVVADALTFSLAGDFLNNGTITANAYNLHIGGDFSYDDAANDFVLGLNDTLTVLGSANIVAADFANSGTIATNSLGITAAGFDNSSIIRVNSNFNVTVATFTNQTGATITAAECNFVHDSFTDDGTITCLDSNTIEATVDNIAEPNNSGLSVNNYETFHIPSNGRVFNNSVSGATSQLLGDVPANSNFISGNAANIILAQVSGTEISLLVGTLEVVGAEAGLIIANPNGISCNGCSFINASEVDLRTDNSIAIADNGLDAADVDILNIRAGSFTNTGVLNANILNLNVDGDLDYTQRGIINTTIFNLEVDGVFSNNDASIGFVWEERDTLTVSGNANITALNFINHGTINVADSGSSGSFEITSGYTAINQGSIVSDILAINAADFFRNLTDGDIDVASLNITAGGKVTNTANINVTGTLTITANDDSTRTDDRTGFYVSNRGNITATTLNITAVDNFYNRGNITATNFTASAKSVFLLNREINSFDGIYDGGNISLARDSSLIAAGIIENYGNIDLGVFNLDISADSFTNHASANITANTVNLAVTSYINDGTIDAVVVSDTTSDQ